MFRMNHARNDHRRAGWLLVVALSAACGCQTVRTPEEKIASSNIPREFQKVTMPDYVVEPPDLLIVEVLEALPGRPISGERLVRPDGKISLGFYGEVYVAGLTIPEVKEKIVLHLRKYLTDEILGLVEMDPETGESSSATRTASWSSKDPKDSDRVFVDVTAYNSKNYYVLGDVLHPGQAADHGQRDRARRDQVRRRPAADGRAPEHPAGPAGSAGRLLRADPAGQPGRDHQRRRPHDQLSAHARRPHRRLSRPDRPLHRLPRPARRTVPDRRRLELADELLPPYLRILRTPLTVPAERPGPTTPDSAPAPAGARCPVV